MGRRQTKADVSLFPFLSVLCAVIGILVLFIVLILSTRVIEQDERYAKTEAQTRRPQAGRPGDNIDLSGIAPEAYAAMNVELERLTAMLHERKADRDALLRRVTTLDDLLEFKKTQISIRVEPVRPSEFARPTPVSVVPDPNHEFRVPLKPVLVEVSSSGYTVHPEKKTYAPVKRDQSQGGASRTTVAADLAAFLRRMQSRKNKEYLVFLIHPNGVSAFDAIRIYLADKHKDVRIGWEPFSREWVQVNRTE